jgi:hypothetical protein
MRSLWIACGLVLLGCGDNSTPSAAITIGVLTARTGAVADPAWDNAVTLAVADVNTALGRTGASFRFKLAIEDSATSPDVSVTRATDLVRMQGAKAIISDTSSDDIALNQLNYDADPSNDLGVPVVCMACTSPAINNQNALSPDPVMQATLRDASRWNWRTCMSTTLQAKVVLQIALQKGNQGDLDGNGQFKLSIYASDEAFGHGFALALAAAAMSLHPNPPPLIEAIFHPVNIDANSYDWASDVAKLTDSFNETSGATDGPPDFVMDVTFPQFDAAMIKAYVGSGQTVPLLHTHASRLATVLLALGSIMEGQEGTSHVLFDGSSGATFATEFMDANSAAPGFLESNAYDAAVAIMLATLVATRGMSDPTQVGGAQIRDALASINDSMGTPVQAGADGLTTAVMLIQAGGAINYEGASGPLDFDAHGNVVDRLTHWKVQNTGFVDAETYDCVADPSCPKL